MLNFSRLNRYLSLSVTPLVLIFSLNAKATVDLGQEWTNDCSTSVSTIQILNEMLSQTQVPLYFDATCGDGGTGPDGQTYQNSVSIQMTASQEIQPVSQEAIGYELTNNCQTTVGTLDNLNNLLAKQGISLYLASQCGPGGTATNGQSYNNSVTVNVNVSSAIEPQ